MSTYPQYIKTALWAEQLDDSKYELSARAEAFLESKAKEFYEKVPISCSVWNTIFGEGQWEHDLWLTQNGHGTGFWDRAYRGPEITKELLKRLQDTLTEAAKAVGELGLYESGNKIECYQDTGEDLSLNEYSWEYTDTFGGEANYSWCKRGTVRAKSLQKAYLLAREEVGLKGDRGKKLNYGDMISFTPSGSCTILFVNHKGG